MVEVVIKMTKKLFKAENKILIMLAFFHYLLDYGLTSKSYGCSKTI